MIPFLAAMTFPPATPPESGVLVLTFPGAASSASMGLADVTSLYTSYDNTGVEINSVIIYVKTPAVAYYTEWTSFNIDPAVDSGTFDPIEFSSAEGAPYWVGAGVYRFQAAARRQNDNPYLVFDIFSDIISLTVT